MAAIISQETWNNFTDKEKAGVRARYCKALESNDENELRYLLNLFGREVLQSNPKIKTWEECVNKNPHFKDDIDKLDNDILYGWDKLREKLIACYKITKLIELGYGGTVSLNEWQDQSIQKVTIRPTLIGFKIVPIYLFADKCLLAFHNTKQAEAFMLHEENIELLKDYYMVKLWD